MHAYFITLENVSEFIEQYSKSDSTTFWQLLKNISNSSVTALLSANSSYTIVIPLFLDTKNYCSLLHVILANFAYPVEVLWFLALKYCYIIWHSNLLMISASDEGYSRKRVVHTTFDIHGFNTMTFEKDK